MARKKKEEIIKEEVKQEAVKAPEFGTGWTGKNNRIQYMLREEKENE